MRGFERLIERESEESQNENEHAYGEGEAVVFTRACGGYFCFIFVLSYVN